GPTCSLPAVTVIQPCDRSPHQPSTHRNQPSPPAINKASTQSLLVTHVRMSNATAISPPPSTRLIQKRKRAAHSKSSPATKRNRPHVFTVHNETYIAEQLVDPALFAACYGSDTHYSGQHLHSRFYQNLADLYNERFNISITSRTLNSKINKMKEKWKSAHEMKISVVDTGGDASLPKIQDQIKERCHYYYILEPALATTTTAIRTKPVRISRRSAIGTISDTDGDDYDGDIYETQARSSSGGPILTVSRKSRVEQSENSKEMALVSQTQSNGSLLEMLKDIKDASELQCEAEKEQTRREQMQFEERARAQQEATKLGQLRLEEARLRVEEIRVQEEALGMRKQLRVEETRLREEELTKREAIRAEVNKMKEQVRMKDLEVRKVKEQARVKELDIEHVNRLLLLEEMRLKRAVAEKENLHMLKVEGDTEATEHHLETRQ
ncbi:MAG: hypothetical protein J3Q66DRAFT_59637, partial [Benniella sp.]